MAGRAEAAQSSRRPLPDNIVLPDYALTGTPSAKLPRLDGSHVPSAEETTFNGAVFVSAVQQAAANSDAPAGAASANGDHAAIGGANGDFCRLPVRSGNGAPRPKPSTLASPHSAFVTPPSPFLSLSPPEAEQSPKDAAVKPAFGWEASCRVINCQHDQNGPSLV